MLIDFIYVSFSVFLIYCAGDRALISSDFPIDSLTKYLLCRFALILKDIIGLRLLGRKLSE